MSTTRHEYGPSKGHRTLRKCSAFPTVEPHTQNLPMFFFYFNFFQILLHVAKAQCIPNLLTNGDFSNRINVGPGAHPDFDTAVNTIIELANPGGSGYVLQQTSVGGSPNTEYEMQLTSELQASTTYVMSAWYAHTSDWNGQYAVFHSRAHGSSEII